MRRNILLSFLCFLTSVEFAAAQDGVAEAEGIWWLPVIPAVLGFAIAIFFWRKSKKGKPEYKYNSRYTNYHEKSSPNVKDDLDEDDEIEWLNNAKRSTTKPAKASTTKKGIAAPAKIDVPAALTSVPGRAGEVKELDFDTKVFQEKMRKLQYVQLPIISFSRLTAPKLFDPLPLSNDESLINAIEQANEEFEEDESVRELAVRILAAFRNRNSVESLTQIALYDLSSNLRSKAVVVLTDFDHQSVFEPILLACADPTREVRAAAARGLFRLSFDRADAWTRILETNDEFRMKHAARAAVESGIVAKSFDRLIHDDRKISYEAFALVTLLVRSGETSEIFAAIKNHKDERVRFALLHVLKVSRDPRTLDGLAKLYQEAGLPGDVTQRLSETICTFDKVTA